MEGGATDDGRAEEGAGGHSGIGSGIGGLPMTHSLPKLPDVKGRQFIAGGRIIFLGDPDEPELSAEPDADELGLDPNQINLDGTIGRRWFEEPEILERDRRRR